jgi:hypothetical protein
MITKDDVAGVRIVMSEVEGWNGNEIHAGKNDGQIMGAWVGKQWPDMLWHCWNAQPLHRQTISDQAAGTRAALSATQAQLADLTDKLRTAVKAPSTANVDEALQMAVTCQTQLADATAQAKTDQDTGNALLRFLGRLFRLG